MKQTIHLTENELHSLIREAIMNMREEIDTGQVPSSQDREQARRDRDNRDADPERKKANAEIRKIRHMIDEYESEGKPTNELTKRIQDIKKRYGMNENVLRKQIKNMLREMLNHEDNVEDYSSAIDFYDMNDVFEKFGVAFTNYRDVENPSTGETGIRYELDSPKDFKPQEFEQALKAAAQNPDGVFISQGQHRNAPEIKRWSVVVLDY